MAAQDNLSQEQFFDQQQKRALDEAKSVAGREHWNDASNVRTDMNRLVHEDHVSKKPKRHMHHPRRPHGHAKNGDKKG